MKAMLNALKRFDKVKLLKKKKKITVKLRFGKTNYERLRRT